MSYREIESIQQLQRQLEEHGGLERAALQGLDLRPHSALLSAVSGQGAVLLGCRLDRALHQRLERDGALVLPPLPGLPYRPFRPALYSAGELMQGYRRGDHASFRERSLDGKIYAHYSVSRHATTPVPIIEALAQRIHDHAIDDALYDLLHNNGDPLRVVAIMGGHRMQRSQPAFATVARLARALTRSGYFVATGGGPGAMEAANLGAYFAAHSAADLQQAVGLLSPVEHYHQEGYFDVAYEVLERFPGGATSLAIPTWFYGHEPANLFASQIAKYFANSIREDGLLAIARHGVIFAPGSAGTIQEIFMDATQNHYATFGQVSPMVFFDRDYWTVQKPVYPLLTGLAGDLPYAPLISINDDEHEILAFIEAHPPVDVSTE